MESKPEATEPATEQPQEAPAAAPVDKAEIAAQRKAERLEKRKEQRKARTEAIKEKKANDAKAKAESADLATPEGAAPKITVAKIPESITTDELKALFEPHGTVLRCEVTKRKGRPTIGTIYFNTVADVRRAYAALHGKHKCDGIDDALSIQFARDAKAWGDFVKEETDKVADCLREHNYKPAVLRNNGVKDFLNRMLLARKKAPSVDLLTAALLVFSGSAKVEQLVEAKVIKSAAPVNQLLKDEKVKEFSTRAEAAAKAPASAKAAAKSSPKEETKAGAKIEKTFDAVVPRLDKLEKDRWNRMAKANLRLSERQRFRFVDILATPSLELWRWMVEDCEMTPAEAGTCFAILQNHYGFTK